MTDKVTVVDTFQSGLYETRTEPYEDEYKDLPPTGRVIDGSFVFGVIGDLEMYMKNKTKDKQIDFYKRLVRRLILRFPEHAGLEIKLILKELNKC